MNQLEEFKYIKRTGFTNTTKIHWIYNPNSNLTVVELDTSALKDTSDKTLNTSALEDTKLVHSSTLNLCTPVHTYNKEDTKDYKKLTTTEDQPKSSSSSFYFSETLDQNILSTKLDSDKRSDIEFIKNVVDHVDNYSDKSNTRIVRAQAALKLLKKLNGLNVIFYSKGFSPNEIETKFHENEVRIPTQEDFQHYKACESGYEWVGAWMNQQREK
jgi:hypothetical protein